MSNQIQNFYKSTISQDWSIGTGNFYVSTKPTTSPGRLVISPSSDTLREIIEYTSTGTDSNGDYIVISARGVGGTTEQTHTVGEKVRMNITAEDWEDMRDDIDSIQAAGAVNASTTERGIVEIATDAQVIAGTDTGETGAKLVATPSQLKANYEKIIPITRRYVPIYESRGDSTSRYDINNPSGTTFRYTWDGTGTDPVINSTTFPTGKKVYLKNFVGNNAYNNGVFTITGSGTNYFEITIPSGGSGANDETNKEIYLITDSFTWTKPTGLKYAEVELVGGSGSVGTPTSGNETGATGSGGYVYKLYNASDLSSTETVTVGIKSFNPLSGNQQQTGATSSIFKSLTGGASGLVGPNNNNGSDGGSASGGDINIPGQNGGASNDYQYGSGGSNPLGFGGVNYNDSQAVIGNGYGSGTSGVKYNDSGNSGNDGIVIIKEFY